MVLVKDAGMERIRYHSLVEEVNGDAKVLGHAL